MHCRIGWDALLIAVIAAGCGRDAAETCNGSASNCDLAYDKVTFAATHDAFAYASGGPIEYIEPNQDLPIPNQLAYGIRGLGIRPCPSLSKDPAQSDVIYVTHNYDVLGGIIGGEPLLDILNEVKLFLDAHPTEVISIFAEDTVVTPAQVGQVFVQAGLGPYLFTPSADGRWPTLRQMARSNQRLVVFDDGSDLLPWQLPMWSYLTDTDYNVTDPSQFSCDYYRGQPGNPLYFINQFIYQDFGGGILAASPAKATIANNPTTAYARAVSCWHQKSRVPNFIYVDFYLEGNVGQVVQKLNALPR